MEVEEEITSEDIVPGDIIAIKNLSMMHCDAILLNGNVIVNEGMLTGESTPVTKIPLPIKNPILIQPSTHNPSEINGTHDLVNNSKNKLNFKEHSKYILFGGTQVMQTRTYTDEAIKAVVLRTGYNTTKGELVRAILYPKPIDFRFNIDIYKYMCALAIFGLIGLGLAIYLKIITKNTTSEVILRSLELITIIMPPALPAALTAALIYVQNRLKKQNIFCISPRTINICGLLNAFVFDKTGTLTENGLDLKFVLPTRLSDDKKTRYFDVKLSNIKDFCDDDLMMLKGMASCNSITRIDGEIVGDPLDCKMFKFTDFKLIEPISDEAKLDNIHASTIVCSKSNTKHVS